MQDRLTIPQFEKWLMSYDDIDNQIKGIASFIQTLDYLEMDMIKRDITTHYLAELILAVEP